MSPRQALLSALHLFVVFAFFLAGFFFLSLPYFPKIKMQIFEKSILIGFLLFLISLILLLGFYALDRGRYLILRMGVSTDIHVIRQTLEEYFARQFANQILVSDVGISWRSRLEIRVVPLEEKERENFLLEVEKQLVVLLRERFGYTKPFHLVVKLPL